MKALKFLSAAILIALSFGFVSCSDDDDDYSSSDLAGTWLIIQSEGYYIYKINGKEEDNDQWNEKYPEDVDSESTVGLYIQLKEDGSAYVGYNQKNMKYNGEWDVKKGKLILSLDEDGEEIEEKWNILKNTSTDLIIDYTMKDTEKEGGNTYYHEVYEKMTWQKVN